MHYDEETIVAVATPPGRGGVGIIRISGKKAKSIAVNILGMLPQPRRAMFKVFLGKDSQKIDDGLAIYFEHPYSFTGEDVLELQTHGSPIVLDVLCQTAIHFGARMANPGEFTLRAFLNGKIDLIQAEAISDLIAAQSIKSAEAASRSLQGVFSKKVNEVVAELIQLRMFIEATVDFPEEDIEFIQKEKTEEKLKSIILKLTELFKGATQGALLQEGLKISIVGAPNVGKSSLLNVLAGDELAIVSDIPGTTRDTIKENILIGGVTLQCTDTAGLRETNDPIEQEGIKRSHESIKKANIILLVVEAESDDQVKTIEAINTLKIISDKPIVVIRNKIDRLPGEISGINFLEATPVISISIKDNKGLDLLVSYLEKAFYADEQESVFIARRRHLEGLESALKHLEMASARFQQHLEIELLAEDCRLAQYDLEVLTGVFTSDDLLGEIFSNFCIGK